VFSALMLPKFFSMTLITVSNALSAFLAAAVDYREYVHAPE
jgi:hypothetical protein